MDQGFADSDILKSVLRKRKMTQEDLALLLKMGRTKLSMILSVDSLSEEFKRSVIEALKLPADTFPERPKQLSRADLESIVPDLAKKVDLILAQQTEILQLLRARQ